MGGLKIQLLIARSQRMKRALSVPPRQEKDLTIALTSISLGQTMTISAHGRLFLRIYKLSKIMKNQISKPGVNPQGRIRDKTKLLLIKLQSNLQVKLI